MEVRTHFIDATDGGWIKGVPCLVPNLQEGQCMVTMGDKSEDYRKWRWRIERIETIVGWSGSVLQNVYLTLFGTEEQWQEIMGKKKPTTTI